jgi:hypothetical protein
MTAKRLPRPRTAWMAAKVTGRLWEMADMVKVLEDWETSETG